MKCVVSFLVILLLKKKTNLNHTQVFNPIALRKAKIVYNFGLLSAIGLKIHRIYSNHCQSHGNSFSRHSLVLEKKIMFL